MLGLVCKMVGFAWFGLSSSTLSIVLSGVVDGFGEWAYSAFYTLLSKVKGGTVG